MTRHRKQQSIELENSRCRDAHACKEQVIHDTWITPDGALWLLTRMLRQPRQGREGFLSRVRHAAAPHPAPPKDSPTRPRFVCAPLPWLKYQGCITFIAVSGNCAPRTEWTPQRRTPAAGHARRLRASHAVRPATLPARSRRDRDAEAGKRRAGRGGIGRSRGTDRWRGVLTFGAGHWRLMRAAVRGTNERRGPSLP